MRKQVYAVYIQLFSSFLLIGLTTFGGPSMITYICRMVVNRKQWLEAVTFDEGILFSHNSTSENL